MKSLVLKLTLPVFLLTPLAASAHTNLTLNGSAVAVLQNMNLPPLCGNHEKDPGEECDEGSKNGDRCSSCTEDCKYQWMPADCQDEGAPSYVLPNSPDLKLNLNQNTAERLREILDAQDDVNHTTQAPPAMGSGELPLTTPTEETEAPTPTQQGSQPDTVDITPPLNAAAGGCSFVELVNAPGSLGQVLVLGLSIIPLAAVRRRKP